MLAIRKVAVLGSGVMGAGIAAHIANAGVPVVLLDIVPDGAKDRSVLAKEALARLRKADPAPFMTAACADLVICGNLEDDLAELETCDWIIEVVLEDLDIKRALYQRIEPRRKAGSVISSNTSTLPRAALVMGQSDAFAQDFLITHFFNPPRYMRLLEIVAGAETRPDALAGVVDFCDRRLGKGVVLCHDTAGFIANRIGTFWIQSALNAAFDMGVSVEQADAVLGRPVGIPKTGVFGLVDLVGIDLMPRLSESLLAHLPEKDPYRAIARENPLIQKMIQSGYTGRKGKGGFYRLGAGRVKEALDLRALPEDFENHYRKADKPALPSVQAGRSGLRAVVESPDVGGRYAWAVLRDTLSYAAGLVPEVSEDIHAIDEAMRLGYNWKQGPFEMIDALGTAWFADKLRAEGKPVPPLLEKVGEGSFYRTQEGKLSRFGLDGAYHPVIRPEGVLALADIKRASDPVLHNGSASVWDLGDGVLCFEKHSKMNTFDEDIFTLLSQAITRITQNPEQYRALVIYNDGSAFSAGANLGLALFAINIALYPMVENFVATGQKIFQHLKHAPFPVVAAPSGLALGGGCEILLHADHVQAHAETYCGLVEVGVGVIPGWGGCKEMILRYREREAENATRLWFSPPHSPMGAVRQAFETIGLAKIAKSAAQAREIGYLRESDGITMNRDRLLFDAKQKALELAKDYRPPEKITDLRLPGPTGKMALDMAVGDLRMSGKATPYDVVVSDHLARVLTGGESADWSRPQTEDDMLALERGAFMHLLRQEGTLQRIEHMLDTGKPLRN